MYDFIIIGSGVAGMYFVHKLVKKYPKVSYLVIEKNERIGGRIMTEKYRSTHLATGAGIIRKDDKEMIKFYEEITQDKLSFFKEKIHYDFIEENDIIVKETIKYLTNESKKASKEERSKLTFKQFALKFFNRKHYQLFLQSSTHTDFENADFVDSIQDYGFEYNIPGGLISTVKWELLIKNLYKLYKKNILLNTKVARISGTSMTSVSSVTLSNKKIILTKNIVVAITSDEINKLIISDIYIKNIVSQPFIKIFAVLNKKLPIRSGETIVDSHLKKIIPLKNQEKINYHLYLIAYSDNEYANFLKYKTDVYILKELNRIFQVPDLKILEIKKYYWKEGTHYYKPLPLEYHDRDDFLQDAQHPFKNMYVIGEMVSQNQGWTQGAIESVEKIFLTFN